MNDVVITVMAEKCEGKELVRGLFALELLKAFVTAGQVSHSDYQGRATITVKQADALIAALQKDKP